MAEYERIGQDELRRLTAWLAEWTWPLTEAASVERATDFGWTVIDENPGKGEVFDTGLMSARSWAPSYIGDGGLYELAIFTSTVVADGSSEGQRYVDDVFSVQIQTVKEVLGEPLGSGSGVNSSAEWQLRNGSTLRVARTDRSCQWILDSPDFVRLQRDVSEITAEEADEE